MGQVVSAHDTGYPRVGDGIKQVDNTTNLLRLMILVALAVGIILARTLLQGRRSRWQQSPYLLTANIPVKEEDESEDDTPEALVGQAETDHKPADK